MNAAVLTRPGVIDVVTDRPVPAPGPQDVLVQVSSVGVCGSDAHYYRHGRIGSFVVSDPLVLGHEAAGHIVAVGDVVPDERIGQRVSIEPQLPCRVCAQCTAGRYNLCPDMRFFATPPVDGALCDFVSVPASFAHPVRDSISDDAAALLEPVSVGVAAVRKAHVGPGDRVLITGGGPIGAICAQTAHAFGAREIVVVEPNEFRRSFVGALPGVTAVGPEHDLTELQADSFLECSGAQPAIGPGIAAVRPAGTVVLVGLGLGDAELPVQLIQNHELTLTGVFRYANTWPLAEALVGDGVVDVDSLVTGRFALDDTAAALDSDRRPDSLKSIISVGTR
ncbi:NAD(P)-dependent alcohol dehydrogenase [uncultured Jatrophihabitans sp.]|uniref:NAD(P)-dependent alcohol dehydrogenase n=1 Tax=uncultured Jatrophihabitans sp. TaxID=1610747 RepID=UPI0035CC351B